MATYIFPPNVDVGKAQTLVSGYGGIFVPSFTQPNAYSYNGTSFVAVSGVSTTYGATASVETSAGTLWTTWDKQGALITSSGALNLYSVASGDVFLNGAAQNNNIPYFSSYSGAIYQVSGTALVSGFAIASGSVGLVQESGNLYSLIAPANEIAEYSISGGTASYSAAPITNILQVMNMAATASGVAVVGTMQGPLTDYGAYNVSTAPDASFSIFANPQNNMLYLLQGPDPNWVVVNSFAASGTAYWCAWNDLSTQVLVTDTNATNLVIYDVANSALSVFQTLTLTVSGATQIQGVPNTSQAVFVNPSHNTVQFLNFASGSWSEGQSISLSNPTCIYAVSATNIVVGNANAVSFLTYSSNTWSVASTTTLSFTPSSIYQDTNGITYAVGTNSGTGYLQIIGNSVGSETWTGSGDAVYCQQGQIIVSDITNKVLRFYSIINSYGNSTNILYTSSGQPITNSNNQDILVLSSTSLNSFTISFENTFSISAGWTNISSSGIVIFGTTNNNLYTYSFTKPFVISPIPYGWAITYSGVWGAVANLGEAFGIPMALTNNPTNNYLTVATTNNQLYEINNGTIVSQSTITNYENKKYNQAIGISDLLWYSDGHLYASTSLNSALLEIA